MPIKPVHPGDPPVAPGPTATPAEHRWFAEDNAYHSLIKKRWDDWVLNHPEDAEVTVSHSFGVGPTAVEHAHDLSSLIQPSITDIVATDTPDGTKVTITGVGLTGASRVTFGGVVGSSISVDSDTHMTVLAPPNMPKTRQPVAVFTPNGDATTILQPPQSRPDGTSPRRSSGL